jgi:hypothetical protein
VVLKPFQIKSKHSKKKKKKIKPNPNPAAVTPLKNRSYLQIWADIELRKLNPKLKLDTMND